MQTLIFFILLLIFNSYGEYADYCELAGPSYCGLSCNIDLSYNNLMTNIGNSVKEEDKFVALTFDDGPSITVINLILSTLKRYNSKATFFVQGQHFHAERLPSLQKILNDGHELGNHAWNHPNMTLLLSEDQFKEMENTSAVITNVTNIDIKWFRPPYGCYDYDVIENTQRLNMDSVMWSVNPRDWEGESGEILADRVNKTMHNGAIILLHDHDGRLNTVNALPKIVRNLKASGYDLVTLSEWEERICRIDTTKLATLRNNCAEIQCYSLLNTEKII